MEELIEKSVIKGLLFSAFDKFGPQPIYMFPKEVSEEEAEQFRLQNIIRLSYRDYTQISIKNLSMMAGDQEFIDVDKDSEKLPYFAILPFPDFNLTSLTIFHFIKFKKSKEPQEPIAAAFSILVDRNRRSFLYNNLNQLKSLVFNFLLKFDKEISNGYKSSELIEPVFKELLLKLIEIEKKPYAPITHATRIKVVFAGLDDSGKTSFLLSVDRKYSKLIGLKPTVGANVSSIQALGASIFLWDLGGQIASRQKYLTKSQIYLYETDLLFYFIDIKNKARFDESIEYFQQIKIALKEFKMDTPIIFILSKGDKDIINNQEIKENIQFIKSKLIELIPNKKPEIFITSIFSIFSILQAFSSGISKLSPNRKLINLILKKFSNRAGISLSLLLNNEGLVLADFLSGELFRISEIQLAGEGSDEEKIRNIFEITAPQFTLLFKIFSEFRALKQDEAIFKIADSIILFKKIRIGNYNFFVLFLMDEEIKKKRINELMPDFMYRTSDLLLRYIS
ncbi:MAG: ADP-ribosylation factor-like protein [Promethearchaeota archaeon]